MMINRLVFVFLLTVAQLQYTRAVADTPSTPNIGNTATIKLSADERAWLQQYNTIRVGTDASWAPFDFLDAQGRHVGLTRDFLDLLEKKTGLHFDYRLANWNRLLDDIRANRLDLLGSVYYTRQRDEFLNYSQPYLEVLDYFFVRDDLRAKTLDDLNGKRVAMPKTYALNSRLKRYFPGLQIVPVDSTPTAIEAVVEGRAEILFDAYAVLNHQLRKSSIASIIPFKSTRHLGSNHLHFVTRDDQPILGRIVNKGLAAITAQEKHDIYSRWLGNGTEPRSTLIDMNEQEREWLRQHPVIRYALDPQWPPYAYLDHEGQPQGLGIEVLMQVQHRLGIRFEAVAFDNWAHSLQQIKQRQVDLLPSAVRTRQRDAFLLFSNAYLTPTPVVYTRIDFAPINSMQDLNHRHVVVADQYNLYEPLARDFPQIELTLVNSTGEALQALSEGRADAYIGDQGSANWIAGQQAITNLRVALIPDNLGDASLRLAVRSDWPLFAGLVKRALAAIPATELLKIRRRWLGAESHAVELQLSETEQAWLKQHPRLRFVGDPNWLPYEAFDEQGRYIGIVAEHLKIIEKKLGIRFDRLPTANWSESVDKISRGEADVISETDNSSLTAQLKFTRAYLSSPLVMVMRDSAGYVENIDQISDQRIAIIRNYGYLPEIHAKYPHLDYREVDAIQDGLTAVSTGAADVLIANLAQASYHMGELGINNIRIVGKTEFTTRLAFGVKPELAPLVPLLNRALASISPSAKQAILEQWGTHKYAPKTDYRHVVQVASIGVTALAFALLWVWYMRRQKERLRISEERFQLAMDAASVGLWDWNAKTGRVYYSPLWMSMLGYEPAELASSFDTFHDLLHPDDRDATLNNTDRMLKDPDAHYEQEFRLRCKDGSYRWILSRGHVFSRDGHGQPLRALGTHTDITARKQAELDVGRLNQNLTAANRRFELAARAIALGVWERSPLHAERLLFDERLLQIYGLPPQEYVTLRQWLRQVHRDDRHEVLAGLRKVSSEGGDAHVDFRAYHSSGELRYIYGAVTAIPGHGDEPEQVIGVNWDITERKLAEEQFRKVLSALPVAVAIADLEGRILLANPQAEKEFGSLVSLIGDNTADFYNNPDQRREIIDIISREGQIVGHEIQYHDIDGRIIEGMLSALPISYNDQPAILGVIVNITERRNMERALAKAKEQAEEANRFKGQFLANMSHEIRTPMNAIVGLGHLLSRTPLDPRQQDYLGKMQISAQSLLTIINDILDLSKIEAGQLHIEHIDFELNNVLETIATLAGTRLAEKPIEFIYDISADVPERLRGDPLRLTQILTNLVGNAVKFTERGGIILHIQPIDTQPLRLSFSVEDTGVGIAAEKLDRLFAPFTQADGSTTREYGGTGLGLSICRQLTELMGGRIHAESTPGQGSRFEFELPFEAPLSRPAVSPRTVSKGLRVLLVDDNEIARQVIADLLLSLSFRVDVTASGAAALDKLFHDHKHYDLLLIDWRMPGLDGFETIRRVRAARLPNPPRIIMMTAYGREAMEQMQDMSDIDGFLIKPLTPSQLMDSVALAMNLPGKVSRSDLPSTYPVPQVQRLQGRVLLVEDNSINQQVAQEILQQMGLQVSLCDDGFGALEQVRQRRPDLVLMDIQMPDMDGYETTEKIRQLPGMADLPIIAMTANAMAGDADRSLEAGMNGHVPKPIDPILLYTTLKQWLPSETLPGNDQGHGQDNRDNAPTVPIQAIESIQFETGLKRVVGNQRLYCKLLRDFGNQFGDTLERLQNMLAQQQHTEMGRLLHTLKGVAGNIGATPLQHTAATLEPLVLGHDMQQLEQQLPQLEQHLQQTLQAAADYVATQEAHEGTIR